MCVASAVTPILQQQWPQVHHWDLAQSREVQEILRRLEALDRKLGAHECPTDAPKEAFLAELAQRVATLERAVGTTEPMTGDKGRT